jgi:hypothetical protein
MYMPWERLLTGTFVAALTGHTPAAQAPAGETDTHEGPADYRDARDRRNHPFVMMASSKLPAVLRQLAIEEAPDSARVCVLQFDGQQPRREVLVRDRSGEAVDGRGAD